MINFIEDNDLEQNYAMLLALFVSYNAESFGFDSKLNGSYRFLLYVYCWIRKQQLLPKNTALSHYIQEF